MDELIPNHQLVLERIPGPDGDLAGWVAFAHTNDGYAAGGFLACVELANHNTASTLTELRCALFFEDRRDRHSGGLSDVKSAVRTLLRAIRAKVAARSWSEPLLPIRSAAQGSLELLPVHWPAGQGPAVARTHQRHNASAAATLQVHAAAAPCA